MDAENKVVDELASGERLRRQQVRTDAELFEGLMRHPGWQRYMVLVESVGQNFHQTMMRPVTKTADVYTSEFAKGALNGLSLAVQLPSAKIKEAADLKPSAEE